MSCLLLGVQQSVGSDSPGWPCWSSDAHLFFSPSESSSNTLEHATRCYKHVHVQCQGHRGSRPTTDKFFHKFNVNATASEQCLSLQFHGPKLRLKRHRKFHVVGLKIVELCGKIACHLRPYTLILDAYRIGVLGCHTPSARSRS